MSVDPVVLADDTHSDGEEVNDTGGKRKQPDDNAAAGAGAGAAAAPAAAAAGAATTPDDGRGKRTKVARDASVPKEASAAVTLLGLGRAPGAGNADDDARQLAAAKRLRAQQKEAEAEAAALKVDQQLALLKRDGPNALDFDPNRKVRQEDLMKRDKNYIYETKVFEKWRWVRYFLDHNGFLAYIEHKRRGLPKSTFPFKQYGISDETLADREYQREQYGVESDDEDRPKEQEKFSYALYFSPVIVQQIVAWKGVRVPKRFQWNEVKGLYADHPIVDLYTTWSRLNIQSDTEEEPVNKRWLEEQKQVRPLGMVRHSTSPSPYSARYVEEEPKPVKRPVAAAAALAPAAAAAAAGAGAGARDPDATDTEPEDTPMAAAAPSSPADQKRAERAARIARVAKASRGSNKVKVSSEPLYGPLPSDFDPANLAERDPLPELPDGVPVLEVWHWYRYLFGDGPKQLRAYKAAHNGSTEGFDFEKYGIGENLVAEQIEQALEFGVETDDADMPQPKGRFVLRYWLAPAVMALFLRWLWWRPKGSTRRFPWAEVIGPDDPVIAAYAKAIAAGDVIDTTEEPVSMAWLDEIGEKDQRRSPSSTPPRVFKPSSRQERMERIGKELEAKKAAEAAAAAVTAPVVASEPPPRPPVVHDATMLSASPERSVVESKYARPAAAAAASADAADSTAPIVIDNDGDDDDDVKTVKQRSMSVEVKPPSPSVRPAAAAAAVGMAVDVEAEDDDDNKTQPIEMDYDRIRELEEAKRGSSVSRSSPPAVAAAAASGAGAGQPPLVVMAPATTSPPPAPDKSHPQTLQFSNTRVRSLSPPPRTSEAWTSAYLLAYRMPVTLTGIPANGARVTGTMVATRGATFEYSGAPVAANADAVARLRKFPDIWRYFNERLVELGLLLDQITARDAEKVDDIADATEASARFVEMDNKTLTDLPADDLTKYGVFGETLHVIRRDIIEQRTQTRTQFFRCFNWSLQPGDPNIVRNGFSGYIVDPFYGVTRQEIAYQKSETRNRLDGLVVKVRNLDAASGRGVAVMISRSDNTLPFIFKVDEKFPAFKQRMAAQKDSEKLAWLSNPQVDITALKCALRMIIQRRRKKLFMGTGTTSAMFLVYALTRRMCLHRGTWDAARHRVVSGVEVLARTLFEAMAFDTLAEARVAMYCQCIAAAAAVDPSYCSVEAIWNNLAGVAIYLMKRGKAPTWPDSPEEPDVREALAKIPDVKAAAPMISRESLESLFHRAVPAGTDAPDPVQWALSAPDSDANASHQWRSVVALNSVTRTVAHPIAWDLAERMDTWHLPAGAIRASLIRYDAKANAEPLHLSESVDPTSAPTMIALLFDDYSLVRPSAQPNGPVGDLFRMINDHNGQHKNVRRLRPTTVAAASSASAATAKFDAKLREIQLAYWTSIVLPPPPIERRRAESRVRGGPTEDYIHLLTAEDLCVAIGCIEVKPSDLNAADSKLLSGPVIAVLDYKSPGVEDASPAPEFHVGPAPVAGQGRGATAAPVTVSKAARDKVNAYVRRLLQKGVPWSSGLTAPTPALQKSLIRLDVTEETKRAFAAAAEGTGNGEVPVEYQFLIKFEDTPQSVPWTTARRITETYPLFEVPVVANPMYPSENKTGMVQNFDDQLSRVLIGLPLSAIARMIELTNNPGESFTMPDVLPDGSPAPAGSNGLTATMDDAPVFRALLMLTHIAPGILDKRITSDGRMEFTVTSRIGMYVVTDSLRSMLLIRRQNQMREEEARLQAEASAKRAAAAAMDLGDVEYDDATKRYVMRKRPIPAAAAAAGAAGAAAAEVGWRVIKDDPRVPYKHQREAIARAVDRHLSGIRANLEFMKPRAGKTLVVRDVAATIRYEIGYVFHTLPVGGMRAVANEWMIRGFKVHVFTTKGVSSNVRKSVELKDLVLPPGTLPQQYTVTLIDHDDLSTAVPLIRHLFPRAYSILDELQYLVDLESGRGRAALEMARTSSDTFMITGTLPADARAAGARPFFSMVVTFPVTPKTLWCLILNLQRDAELPQTYNIVEKMVTAELTADEVAEWDRRAPPKWGGTNRKAIAREDVEALATLTRDACKRKLLEYVNSKLRAGLGLVIAAPDNPSVAEFKAALVKQHPAGAVEVFSGGNYDDAKGEKGAVRGLIINPHTNPAGFSLAQFNEKVAVVDPMNAHIQYQFEQRVAGSGQKSPIVTSTYVVDSKGFWQRVWEMKPFPKSMRGMVTQLLAALNSS